MIEDAKAEASNSPVTQVTIVGGGTAGWITALILTTFLNRFRKGPPVEVSVIESPNIPTVGVGEATVTGMSRLLRQMAIDEHAFFRACNASFKLSVRFSDWSRKAKGQPLVFYHPFNFPPLLDGQVPAYHYRRFGPAQAGASLVDALVPNGALVSALKGPRPLAGRPYDAAIGYAYHLDAGLFAGFLRDVARSRGLKHIRDDVVSVELDDSGAVAALQLQEGGRHPVQLVVDCTGFRGLILQKAMGEPFVGYEDSLFNDRAIPVQIPHPDPTKLEPCTRSTALGAGWVWRVPLFNRIGTGYVYCSRFRSEEQARAEFFAHLRRTGDLPADAPDPETRVVKMRIGRMRRAWVKNCVAIGLSSSFVEPLESTAIFMIEMAARWLVNYFPDQSMNPALAMRYNQLAEDLFEEVRDFIGSHYQTSNRQDPFWLAARKEAKVSDRLNNSLELWQQTLPSVADTRANQLFNYWSYIYTLGPKGYFPDRPLPMEEAITEESWRQHTTKLSIQNQQLLTSLPNHYDLLCHIRGGSA